MQEEIRFLLDFADRSRSPFHAAAAARDILREAGFTPLPIGEAWELAPGGKYYTDLFGTSLIAFKISGCPDKKEGARIAAAHLDWPCLRVKPSPEIRENGYLKLNTEAYGGLINNTWLDRPLGIAGRVVRKGEDPFHPVEQLVDADRDLLIIPNVAIHQNPKVNEGVELNRQTDMLPLLGLDGEEAGSRFFTDLLAEELSCAPEDILDYELCLYNRDKGCPVGRRGELISAPRLDDLTSAAAALWGLIHGERAAGIDVVALYDHEEIGNKTKQGAASASLSRVLEKIRLSLGGTREDFLDSCFRSLLLSMDVGHAIHPNKPGVYDVTNKPALGQGLLLKMSSSQSYATDSRGIAVVEGICRKHGIPYRKFVNRSDVRGGGTLGNAAAVLLPVMTVDLGIPLLAMHSARELMAAADQLALDRLMTAYYSEP